MAPAAPTISRARCRRACGANCPSGASGWKECLVLCYSPYVPAYVLRLLLEPSVATAAPSVDRLLLR